MPRTLVIAEKPSVGADYARVLGCTAKGDGCLIGEKFVVTWAVGHLVTLSDPDSYDEKYKYWRLEDLPIMPERFKHKVIPQSKRQFDIVKSWMNSPDITDIICGTDSGREGELIFRYIYHMAGCKKPFSRLWVSSMTEEAITEGFKAIKPGTDYDKLYDSARCRSEADWLVGMNGTRAYSKRFGGMGFVLSVGRVQTPTLGMIVSRQQEIDHFVPKDFYEVKLTHCKEESSFDSRYFRLEEDGKTRTTRIDEVGEAEKILNDVKGAGLAKVVSVTKTPKKQAPPLLYDLTELQRDGNRKYGYSANKVLELAQALYEKHKILTYPRTDSRYLSDDMKAVVPNILKAISIPEFQAWINGIPQPLAFSKRIIDNTKITDHHAIIPTTKRPNLSQLTQEEKNIYTLVVKRLIEVFYPPYEYEVTEVCLEAASYSFLARGRVVKAPGYTVLSEKGTASDEEEEEGGALPPLRKGEEVAITGGEVQKKQTQPPKPFTEATLLTAMEYAGKYIEDEATREKLLDALDKLSLGTPATRAAVIERLLNVGYITRKGKALLPTEKGKELIRIVPMELKSPEMTGKWERALEHIYKGSMEPVRFMESIKKYVNYIVNDARTAPPDRARFVMPEKATADAKTGAKTEAAGSTQRKPKENYGTCPLCGKGMIYLNRKAYYCSEYQSGCKLTLWKDSLDKYGTQLTDDLVRKIAQDKQCSLKLTMPQTNQHGTGTIYVTPAGKIDVREFRAE